MPKKNKSGGGTTATAASTLHPVITINLTQGSYAQDIAAFRALLNGGGNGRTGGYQIKLAVTNTDFIEARVTGDKLYVYALKGANQQWYHFPGETETAPTATGSKEMLGSSNYNSLLSNAKGTTKSLHIPVKLVTFFKDNFAGNTTHDNAIALITLIVAVSEATRFSSVEAAVLAYINGSTLDFNALMATVRNWDQKSKAADPDVLVRCTA